MNYKESKIILEEVKKSKRILINCHRSPDPDSVGSALSVYQALKTLGKKATIISPGEINESLKFLPYSEKIQIRDFAKFKYENYDLFIILDSSDWRQASGNKELGLPDINTVVIDHHSTNKAYGRINLINLNVNAVCELLYFVFKDWNLIFNQGIATTLLTGLYSDTVSFRYINNPSKTFAIVSDLIEKGANYESIAFNLTSNSDYSLYKFYGEALQKMKIDKEAKFVWTAISYELYLKYGKPKDAKSNIASIFFNSIKNTEFGIVMVEQEKGILSMSFRSRGRFDVSKLAQALGGSGHKAASGGYFEFQNFNEAVEKVLRISRKYSLKK